MKGKLFETLATFSEKEFKAFENWLKSPWTNSNKGLVTLLQKLKKYHPTYDHRLLTKERLYKQIMPSKTYNADMLNNLLSQGYLQAKKFLTCERFLQEESLNNRLLRIELEARDLEVDYFKNIDKEVERLESLEIKSWEDHAEIFQLHREVYHYPNQTVRIQPGSETIQKMNEGIDIVFLLEKAAIINEMIVRQRIVKGEKYEIAEPIDVWKKMAKEVNHPSINLYKLRFDYKKGELFDQYQKLKKLFFETFEQLNYKEKKIQLISLLNDYTFIQKEHRLDYGERLPIYKLGLSSGVILNKGKISRVSFVGIIVISNHVKDFDFTDKFIETYYKRLPEDVQDDGRQHGIAHTLYRREKLEQAVKILMSRDFKSDYYNISSRLLNMQVHFDLFLKDDSYFTLFNSLLNANEKWLQREKKYSKHVKQSHLRFYQKCRILANTYYDPNYNGKKLAAFLDPNERIQAFNWLEVRTEKIIKLKTKRAT